MLPLILIPIGAAVIGSATGAKGGTDIWSSRKRVKAAQHDLSAAQESLMRAYVPVQQRADAYAQQQAHVYRTVVEPFVAWLEQHEAAFPHIALGMVSADAPPFGDGAGSARLVELRDLAAKSITAVSAAAGVPTAAMGFAAMFGTASTGASISGLSGVAATNASLAWLGGGSLATGGGGMAAGQLLIVSTTGAVGVLALGLGALVVGEKAKTQAAGFCAQVAEAIARLEAQRRFARRIVARIDEVSRVLAQVSGLAAAVQHQVFQAVERGEAVDDAVLRLAVRLTLATARILATPIVAADGLSFHVDLGPALSDAQQAVDEGDL